MPSVPPMRTPLSYKMTVLGRQRSLPERWWLFCVSLYPRKLLWTIGGTRSARLTQVTSGVTWGLSIFVPLDHMFLPTCTSMFLPCLAACDKSGRLRTVALRIPPYSPSNPTSIAVPGLPAVDPGQVPPASPMWTSQANHSQAAEVPSVTEAPATLPGQRLPLPFPKHLWVNSEAIWRQTPGSTLAQVMACCLTATLTEPVFLDTCLHLMATLNPNTCILITLIYILTISVFLQDSLL